MSEHQENRNDAHCREHEDDVSIDAVEQEKLVSNDGNELEADEERGGEDASKMYDDANSISAKLAIVIASSREGAVRGAEARTTEDIVDVEIHEAREGEAEEGTDCVDEEDEVVSLLEAKWVVDLAGHGHEGVCWGSDIPRHCA